MTHHCTRCGVTVSAHGRRCTDCTRTPTNPSTWVMDAACIGQDPALFFPVGRDDNAQAQTTEAKAICRTCPVTTTECAAWAWTNRERAGIWGGIDEHERERAWRHKKTTTP